MTRHIGPYELIQPLGAGGMAQVWMGQRVAMGGARKTVAIKLMGDKVADNPEFRRMFMAEARLSMLLTNSNIVQVFDVGEDRGTAYMVMEWVDGLNLSQLCKRVRKAGEHLPPVLSVYVVAEVLRALSYAHNLIHENILTEVVHRDISPQNVMLSVSGEVKLMDFGIARLSTEDTSGVHVKGKLRYMPPEQLRGNARRATVDLFAVGAILHELLEGRRFRSQVVDEARLYGMILDGEVPPLELPGGHTLPRELEELRRGLLEARADDRISTAKEALRLLYRWSGYRNCSLDLEALVQRFVGTEAPRTSVQGPVVPLSSGIQPAAPLPSSAPPNTPASLQPRRSVAPLPADSVSDAPSLQTAPSLPPGAQVTAATLREPQQPTGEEGSKTPVAALSALAVCSLAVGVLGLGFGFDWWGTRAEVDEPEPSVEPARASATPAPSPTSQSTKPSAPRGEAAPAAVAEPAVAEPAVAEPTTAEPETPVIEDDPSPAQAKPKAPPVSVELVANDYYYVEAKIAGKVYKLSPIAKAKLRPGSHSVHLRKSSDAPWVKAGRIRVVAGATQRVEMLDPPGAKISKI